MLARIRLSLSRRDDVGVPERGCRELSPSIGSSDMSSSESGGGCGGSGESMLLGKKSSAVGPDFKVLFSFEPEPF